MALGNTNGGVVSPARDVAPELLGCWLASDGAVLIDVRDAFEYAEEHINGAILHPLSEFDSAAIRQEHAGKRIVFQCRTGSRSARAAERFKSKGEPVFQLSGGIEAWKEQGRPVVRPAPGAVLPIMRQVQIVAGALITFGVGMGLTVSPWFLGIAGFVGLGLMFAGISGWCGMARLLAVMPWNKRNKRGQLLTFANIARGKEARVKSCPRGGLP